MEGDQVQQNNLNWWSKLKDIEKILNLWKRRNLTLLGKITIIKSLIVPKIFYSLCFLDPPKNFINECESTFYKFIWGKEDSIKRKTIIANIREGGLNMIDIESQVIANRATWMHKILNSSGNWTFFGKTYIDKFGPNRIILRGNLCNQKFLPEIRNLPQFYQDVILSYNRARPIENITDMQSFLGQALWGNMNFLYDASKSGQKPALFFHRWIESGLIYLGSFRFKNGTLDEDFIFEKVKNKSNIYCEILCVKKALKPFEDIIKNIHTCGIAQYVPNREETTLGTLKCRSVYEKIKKQKIIRPFQEQKWKQVLDQYEINFDKTYLHKIKYIHDKKLSEFNFKVLHLILPCGLNQKRWGHKTDETCDICKVTHDIIHMLFYCAKAKQIWSVISQVFNLNISLKDIIITDFERDMCIFISLISFLIYKEWLLFSNDKSWKVHDIIGYIKWELRLKSQVYEKLENNCENVCHYSHMFINHNAIT